MLYADDKVLLSRTCHGIYKMFGICDKHGHIYSLSFNKDKTNVIIVDENMMLQVFS